LMSRSSRSPLRRPTRRPARQSAEPRCERPRERGYRSLSDPSEGNDNPADLGPRGDGAERDDQQNIAHANAESLYGLQRSALDQTSTQLKGRRSHELGPRYRNGASACAPSRPGLGDCRGYLDRGPGRVERPWACSHRTTSTRRSRSNRLHDRLVPRTIGGGASTPATPGTQRALVEVGWLPGAGP
jgi:hypothetical protein